MTAITAKALDTRMQYDTEAAWKSFGRVLKKVAADLKGPWGCAKELDLDIFNTFRYIQ